MLNWPGAPVVLDGAKLQWERNRRRMFPFVVLDDVFDPEVLERLLDEWPQADDPLWRRFGGEHEVKFEGTHPDLIPEVGRDLLDFWDSEAWLAFLHDLTGDRSIVADSSRIGAGLHAIPPDGGKLDVHVDFNVHPHSGLKRRLNQLLYLNRGWDKRWGGCLELHGPKGRVEIVPPEFNRLVIFETSERSYHGHPVPLRGPEGRWRRSIATYFYGGGEVDNPHSTVWQ